MHQGTVAALYRWPVKSLRGERVAVARFDARGMAGDRAYSLTDQRENRQGNRLRVKNLPALLTWASAYPVPGDGAADPSVPPVLRSPEGKVLSWTDPSLPKTLTASLGVPVALAEHGKEAGQDRGPTVLVTFAASLAALAEELGGEVDVRRFRSNLHLTSSAPAFAEEHWGPGTLIRAGDVRLAVTGDHAGPCIRCAVPSWDPAGTGQWPKLQTWLIEHHENKFGIIMRVTEAGVIRDGDAVAVSPAPE